MLEHSLCSFPPDAALDSGRVQARLLGLSFNGPVRRCLKKLLVQAACCVRSWAEHVHQPATNMIAPLTLYELRKLGTPGWRGVVLYDLRVWPRIMVCPDFSDWICKLCDQVFMTPQLARGLSPAVLSAAHCGTLRSLTESSLACRLMTSLAMGLMTSGLRGQARQQVRRSTMGKLHRAECQIFHELAAAQGLPRRPAIRNSPSIRMPTKTILLWLWPSQLLQQHFTLPLSQNLRVHPFVAAASPYSLSLLKQGPQYLWQSSS